MTAGDIVDLCESLDKAIAKIELAIMAVCPTVKTSRGTNSHWLTDGAWTGLFIVLDEASNTLEEMKPTLEAMREEITAQE